MVGIILKSYLIALRSSYAEIEKCTKCNFLLVSNIGIFYLLRYCLCVIYANICSIYKSHIEDIKKLYSTKLKLISSQFWVHAI